MICLFKIWYYTWFEGVSLPLCDDSYTHYATNHTFQTFQVRFSLSSVSLCCFVDLYFFRRFFNSNNIFSITQYRFTWHWWRWTMNTKVCSNVGCPSTPPNIQLWCYTWFDERETSWVIHSCEDKSAGKRSQSFDVHGNNKKMNVFCIRLVEHKPGFDWNVFLPALLSQYLIEAVSGIKSYPT